VLRMSISVATMGGLSNQSTAAMAAGNMIY
jgi:hypothetical protein